MRLIFKEMNTYIPSWNGNKKESATDQIKIYWRFPTAEEVKEIRSRSNPKAKMIDGEMKTNSFEIEIIVDELLAVKKLVTRIENLFVNNKEIIDGEALIKEQGLNGLYQEIATEILAKMDEVKNNSKNS